MALTWLPEGSADHSQAGQPVPIDFLQEQKRAADTIYHLSDAVQRLVQENERLRAKLESAEEQLRQKQLEPRSSTNDGAPQVSRFQSSEIAPQIMRIQSSSRRQQPPQQKQMGIHQAMARRIAQDSTTGGVGGSAVMEARLSSHQSQVEGEIGGLARISVESHATDKDGDLCKMYEALGRSSECSSQDVKEETATSRALFAPNATMEDVYVENQESNSEVPENSIFNVGDEVKCRYHGEDWQSGVVACTDPLEVNATGWAFSCAWDEVVPKDNMSAAPTPSPTSRKAREEDLFGGSFLKTNAPNKKGNHISPGLDKSPRMHATLSNLNYSNRPSGQRRN